MHPGYDNVVYWSTVRVDSELVKAHSVRVPANGSIPYTAGDQYEIFEDKWTLESFSGC